MSTMKALMSYGGSDAKVELIDLPIPQPGPEDVLLRVKSVAICHTDLIIMHGNAGHCNYPVVPGHELSGEIAAVGSSIDWLKPGDAGSVHGCLFCGHCSACRRGNLSNCENFLELGSKIDGGMAEYVVFPGKYFFPLKEGISFDEAALYEPLANAVNVVEKARLKPLDNVVVIGPGAIGILVAQVAATYSPKNLIIVGTRDERLSQAKEIVPSAKVVNCKRPEEIDALKELLKENRGADAVLECAGTVDAVKMAFDLVGNFGRTCIEGSIENDEPIPLYTRLSLQDKRYSVTGVSGWTTVNYQRGIDLVDAGAIRLAPLVTAKYPLADWKEAVKSAEFDRSNLRVVINP